MRVRIIEKDIWTIGYIESSEGGNLDELFETLSGDQEKAAMGMLELFANISNESILVRQLSDKLCKNIEKHIREFRKGNLRVLWFYDESKVIICTHGFFKNTQKTPNREKTRARNCYEQYQNSKPDIEFIEDD